MMTEGYLNAVHNASLEYTVTISVVQSNRYRLTYSPRLSNSIIYGGARVVTLANPALYPALLPVHPALHPALSACTPGKLGISLEPQWGKKAPLGIRQPHLSIQ